MSQIPASPKIYHITHLRNIHDMAMDEWLLADAVVKSRDMDCALVGMPHIKQRRLELDVKCHPGTNVGEYVPFYFCPRSIMLYILYRGNHQDIDYHGGQAPIVHLVADLAKTVEWATENKRKWAFTNRNAGSQIADFFDELGDLDKLDWIAIQASDWRDPQIKEGKQAEFLVYKRFPWFLVERIGVASTKAKDQVESAVAKAGHKPRVEVRREWYY